MRTVLRDSYIVLFFLPDKLTQEYDALQNKTFTYTYDGNGNILSVAETGGATKTYVYGDANWGDLLTSYDGQTITYDEIGNPLSYLGATLTWTNGRRLASYTKGDTAVTYTYNANGMRTSKTVNGVTTDYVYDGSTLLAQKTGDNWMYFIYSPRGVIGFDYNGTNYYYVQNVQGDVVAVMNDQGGLVYRYTYDSWGKLLTVTDANGDSITDSTHIALLNPIRYRSYLYDSDTGFYYLQSRYYDPVIKRFINADGLIDNRGIGTQNMFAYCYNNPVRLTDSSGNVPDDYLKQIAQECPGGPACQHTIFRHDTYSPTKKVKVQTLEVSSPLLNTDNYYLIFNVSAMNCDGKWVMANDPKVRLERIHEEYYDVLEAIPGLDVCLSEYEIKESVLTVVWDEDTVKINYTITVSCYYKLLGFKKVELNNITMTGTVTVSNGVKP